MCIELVAGDTKIFSQTLANEAWSCLVHFCIWCSFGSEQGVETGGNQIKAFRKHRRLYSVLFTCCVKV